MKHPLLPIAIAPLFLAGMPAIANQPASQKHQHSPEIVYELGMRGVPADQARIPAGEGGEHYGVMLACSQLEWTHRQPSDDAPYGGYIATFPAPDNTSIIQWFGWSAESPTFTLQAALSAADTARVCKHSGTQIRTFSLATINSWSLQPPGNNQPVDDPMYPNVLIASGFALLLLAGGIHFKESRETVSSGSRLDELMTSFSEVNDE